MSEEEKKAIETFIKKCERYDGSVEIKGISVGEEIRILDTIVKFLKELNNLKEIEKSHKEENGKLRVEFEKVYQDNLTLAKELEQEKEKNKELYEALERSSGRVTELTVENSDLKYQIYHKQQMIDELTKNEENLKIELGKEKEKNKELENELDKTTYLLSRCNKRLEDIARELTAEIKTGYDYTEIMQEIQSLKENECTATKCQMIKENYISKDKIKEKIALLKDILKAKEKDGNIYKQIPIEYLKGAIEQLEELLEEK